MYLLKVLCTASVRQTIHCNAFYLNIQASEKLKLCWLNTVAYGTASAPFLSIRCLIHLSEIHIETVYSVDCIG